MYQRRLYKTIASFASQEFKSDKQLLKHVVNEIVRNEKIRIKGGRIWEYDAATESYRLIHQKGVIEQIKPGYRVSLSSYPIFLQVGRQRSVIAHETDRYLRRKGIIKYSATGVGDIIQMRKGPVYQYVLAFNADSLDEELLTELNIISLAVTARLKGKRIERRAELLQRDLEKAREIQQSVLPEPALRFHNYEVYGISIPDRVVGGDFFDYVLSEEEKDRLTIVVGDAASKGFRAAAQALYVVGALRMGIIHQTKISLLMSRINKLVHSTFSEEQFLSMFYVELFDDRKGLVLYSNAGHNAPILFRVHDRSVESLEATGQILGPFPDQVFRVENSTMAVGDVLVMFTDGISEAMRGGSELYGEKRLVQVIEKLHTRTPEEICKAILEDVDRFAGRSEANDDKTIVVVKRVR